MHCAASSGKAHWRFLLDYLLVTLLSCLRTLFLISVANRERFCIRVATEPACVCGPVGHQLTRDFFRCSTAYGESQSVAEKVG